MKRLALGDALAELLDGLLADDPSHAGMRLSSLHLDLPLEVSLAWDDGRLVFLGNPRRWRLQTPFDERPGRLALSVEAVPA